ncbi:MAG: glycosyltransferase family 2 protein [bacterium]|nr:glycosyltransferase family 2 protein [bacterium]
MDHISIIIVHYNTPKETKECLESLAVMKTQGMSCSVVIVDNASMKPFDLPQKFTPKMFEVVRSESNLGFTGGNNLGISYALEKYNSDYVLLLNSDTTVEPNFLQQLYKASQASPHQGVICPAIYFSKGREFFGPSYTAEEKGNVFWYAGGSIDWQNVLCFHRGVDEVDRNHVNLQTKSDFATGCCMLIKREVLEKIGLLDERFFLYLEDVDFSVRAMKHGYEIGFAPESKIWHKNAGSSGGAGSPLQQYYQTRNRLLFAFKHGSLRLKITMIKYALRLMRTGQRPEKIAAFDVMRANFGKKVVL